MIDMTSRIYPLARRFYEAQQTCFNWRTNNRASNWVRQEAKAALDYDFHKFVRIDAGKLRAHLADIPKGAILLLLYPATVGPRLFRAWQRGRENNDYREMGDVLRRDLTAITLLIYALPAFVRALSGQMQKLSKINLVDRKTDKVLIYSQFKDFNIDNPKILQAIVAENNGTALKKVVNALNDNGLSRFGHTAVADRLRQLKNAVGRLVDLHESGQATPENLAKHAEETFRHFTDADDAARHALTAAYEKGSPAMQDAAKGLQGRVKGVLQNYAKVSRLPVDMISLAAVVGLTGFLPVWFNSKWNQWQFQRKMTAEPPNSSASQSKAPPPSHNVTPVAIKPPAFQAAHQTTRPTTSGFAFPAQPLLPLSPGFSRWG